MESLTIFYYILDESALDDKEIDSIDKALDSAMRNSIMNNFVVMNFQDKIFNLK